MKWMFSFLLCCSAAFTWNFQDIEVDGYSFEWDRREDFDQACEMFWLVVACILITVVLIEKPCQIHYDCALAGVH